MARTLLLKISCVSCEADIPPDDPAYDVPVLVRFERREGQLDLCGTCRDALAEQLQPYLDRLESTITPAKAPARANSGRGKITSMNCPECGRVLAGAVTSLRNHLTGFHGMSRDAVLREFPLAQVGIPYLEQFPHLAHLVNL